MKTMRGFAMLKIGETGWVTKGFRPAVRRTPSPQTAGTGSLHIGCPHCVGLAPSASAIT